MSAAAVIAAARVVAQDATYETLTRLNDALREHDAATFDDCGFDPATRRLTGATGEIVLAQQETRILRLLIADRGAVVPHSWLTRAASCDGEPITIGHLRLLIERMRKKFRAIGRQDYIASRKNDGYVLLAPQMDTAP